MFISTSRPNHGRVTDNDSDSGSCVVLYAANHAQFPLLRLLFQLEKIVGNAEKAEAIKNGGGKEMSNAARKYLLFVSEFFMKHVNLFIKIVMKHSLQIEHYWGCVEFAPGRGAIHLHVVAIAKDRAYSNFFIKLQHWKERQRWSRIMQSKPRHES